jgi:hypothetical protein
MPVSAPLARLARPALARAQPPRPRAAAGWARAQRRPAPVWWRPPSAPVPGRPALAAQARAGRPRAGPRVAPAGPRPAAVAAPAAVRPGLPPGLPGAREIGAWRPGARVAAGLARRPPAAVAQVRRVVPAGAAAAPIPAARAGVRQRPATPPGLPPRRLPPPVRWVALRRQSEGVAAWRAGDWRGEAAGACRAGLGPPPAAHRQGRAAARSSPGRPRAAAHWAAAGQADPAHPGRS